MKHVEHPFIVSDDLAEEFTDLMKAHVAPVSPQRAAPVASIVELPNVPVKLERVKDEPTDDIPQLPEQASSSNSVDELPRRRPAPRKNKNLLSCEKGAPSFWVTHAIFCCFAFVLG
eukprot:2039057-Karenia_brevis.AAC.1